MRLELTHPQLQLAADAVHTFAFAWFRHERPRKLVLYGPSGCGKTALARALFRWARASSSTARERTPECPFRIEFIRWQEISDQLEDARSSVSGLLGDTIDHSLLIVDDIGAESDRFKSGKVIDALGYLLTRRQDRGFTILTTNIPPTAWKDKWDDRVNDRLMRDAEIIDMSACPSWTSISPTTYD